MKLYSKAAKVLSEMTEPRLDMAQTLKALKNKGVKQAEIDNSRLPESGRYDRQDVIEHFQDKVPKVGVTKFGGVDLNELSSSQARELNRLYGMRTVDMSLEDIARQERLEQSARRKPTTYGKYQLPGGNDYQEHLLQLPGERMFTSGHWIPGNILAHVRLSNRIMPDGRKLLHVEEVQSDWGQEGREKGFHDPENPFQVFDTKTGKVISSHPTHSAAWDAYRKMPDEEAAGLDYGSADNPPSAPYVTSTEGWTDLALKHILSHAAAGNYDGVIFTPGKAQTDRYGLRNYGVDQIAYSPDTNELRAYNEGRMIYSDSHKPEELPKLIGKERSDRLLSQPLQNEAFGNKRFHVLQGGDLDFGGEGMQHYYDKMLPSRAMKLVQQHDPSVKGGYEPINHQYSGFSIPITPKMRDSIKNNGFEAFKRGGYAG